MQGSIRKYFLLTLVFSIIASLAFSDPIINHRKKQLRPIKSGTSGGNIKDKTQFFCCSGTIGAQLKDANGKIYFLSNNHVFAKSNFGHLGDPISQPGLIDILPLGICTATPDLTVGTLSKFVRIAFGQLTNNKVDAAIALAGAGMAAATGSQAPVEIDTLGTIIAIGQPGPAKLAALGMSVQKSGRTTGLRTGTIDLLGATIFVRYGNQCGGPETKIARFINQMRVKRGGLKFIDSGDSGSLLVQNIPCKNAIGLLPFGDDPGNGFADQIQDVLTLLSNPIQNVQTPGLQINGKTCSAAPAEAENTLTLMDTRVMAVKAIQARHEARLMAIPGVVGVGVGFARPDSGSKELALVVLVTKGSRAETSSSAIPSRLDGIAVRREVSSEIRAL
jgi:hypothetical protein